MKRKGLFIIAIALVLAAGVAIAATMQDKGVRLAREARITMAQARQAALARVPGKVESGRLERENGRVVFEFEIHTAQNTEAEVYVDAATGEVVKTEAEEGRASEKEIKLMSEARVTMEQAEQTALARVAGTVVEAELERERGKVLYSFEIVGANGDETEIHVDAVTGQIESVED